MTNKNQKRIHTSNLEILYQDQWIVVINKPEGLLSVPYSGCSQKTAINILEEMMRKKGLVNSKHHPFAVHRLDRDTSGVMMFALSRPIQQKMMNNWQKIVTERLYRCISEISKNADAEILSNHRGIICDKLAKNAHHIGFVPKNNDKAKNGRAFKTVEAKTHYHLIDKNRKYALFELELETGKKNQIRAHLAAHGFPIAGDIQHRAITNPFSRLCLHARTLEFYHPQTNEKMKFEVPEPVEWSAK